MDWIEERQQNIHVPMSMPFTGVEYCGCGSEQVARYLAHVLNDPTPHAYPVDAACAAYSYPPEGLRREGRVIDNARVEPSPTGSELAVIRFRVWHDWHGKAEQPIAENVRRLAVWLESGASEFPGWTVRTSRGFSAPRGSVVPDLESKLSWGLGRNGVEAWISGPAWGASARGGVSVLTENGWFERRWQTTRKVPRDGEIALDMAATFFPALEMAKGPIAEAEAYLRRYGPRKPRDTNAVFELPASVFGETRVVKVHEDQRGWAYSLEHVFAGTAGRTGKKVYPSLARFKHVEGKWLLAEDNWCLNRDGGRKINWLDKLEKTETRALRHGKGQ